MNKAYKFVEMWVLIKGRVAWLEINLVWWREAIFSLCEVDCKQQPQTLGMRKGKIGGKKGTSDYKE